MNNVLIHCLLEEWTANGGCFASPDTGLWFTQKYCDFDESIEDAFKRLIKNYHHASS